MVHKTRQEAYHAFIELVLSDSQQERTAVNRKMLSVLLWCFVFPAVLSGILLVLVRQGIVPFRARVYTDWLFLIFPISYSLYFLTSEVLRDLPGAFRRGGIASNLRQCQTEGAWRERVVELIRRTIQPSREDWRWISASFKMDIERFRYRTRFVTALAGAVFFMITQGLDMLSEDEGRVTLVKDPNLGWVELSPSDTTQWAGLILFLVLLYLSGSQTTQSLVRYLDCAELGLQDSDGQQS